MVNTRGKKKTPSSSKTPKANEVAENALAEGHTSHSLTVNVEESNVDGQFEDKVEIPFVEAENEGYEEILGEEESEKVTKVDNNDENILVNELNNDNKAESEQNTSEDDETDDQEDLMWDDEEEISEEDNEENVADEDEASEEDAIKEDDDGDEVSLEEASEEEDDDEDEVSRQKATKVAKGDERKAKAKEDGREAKEHNSDKVEAGLKNDKNSDERNRKKVRVGRSKKVDSKDKPESSRKRKGKKRVESMGMIFMCSSKTKNDCYQYRVLGLPESKKDMVERIYTGMRLFLYDVDLKLMYGIYKAAGPGGYNIEPKAFKSQFPAQVRFAVLDDCLPLPEEKFKKVIKENYFTNTKFDCQLKAEQVKKLCRLFLASRKEHLPKKSRRPRKAEKPHHPVRQERSRRRRVGGGDERRLALGDEPRYRERPRKRPRKLVISPPRQPPPAPLPSTVPSYLYERTSDVDAYRRDQYPYRDRRDPPLVIHRDPFRDGRDPYPERDYPYRDGRDLYIERRDSYRDGRDIYSRGRDPYVDGRASYLERRDPYRDGQDPDVGIRSSYRDGRDTYLERRDLYRDATYSEPYSSYGRDPLSDPRDAFRREEVLQRGELHHPFGFETKHRHDIGSRDSYVSNRQPPSYADPVYSAEYPSRAGLAREYHL